MSCIVHGASTASGVDCASIADDNAELGRAAVDPSSLLASAVVTIKIREVELDDGGRTAAPRLTSQVDTGL